MAAQKAPSRLRSAISTYLSNTRGVVAGAQNILITKGSQMGIYLASQLLLKPSDTIAVGTSSYTLADDTFKQAGARLIRIPVDDHGMDIDNLEKFCSVKRSGLYTVSRIITAPPRLP